MSKMKFKLNSNGVKELLKSSQMMNICNKHAINAQKKLGTGYEITSFEGKNRVNASVSAVTHKARKENAEENTILKAVMSS